MQKTNKLSRRLGSFILAFVLLTTLFSSAICYAASTPQETAILKAEEWLKAQQNADGSWGNGASAFIDTSAVSEYLTGMDSINANLQLASTWMENFEIKNNDVAARFLPYIDNADKNEATKNFLLSSQNADGGWGIAEDYQSDLIDTVLVLKALASDASVEQTVLQNAVSYILSSQQSNGAWAYHGDDDVVISLTAQTALALNQLLVKSDIATSAIQTAIRKAGEYLISVQNSDKTWGTGTDTITNTLLCYNAVLCSVGAAPVGTVEASILACQNADGSWYDSPYITALAVNALKAGMDMPGGTINAIKLYKNINGTNTECYSYNAFESFEIDADCEYDAARTSLLYFVKQLDGSLYAVQTDGQPGWNTKNSLPGDYSVIVQIKDEATGRIIASQERQFAISSCFSIANIIINTDPESIRVNNPCEVNTEITLYTNANIDKLLSVKTTVLDGDTVIGEDEKTIESIAAEPVRKILSLSFTPDVSVQKDYTIRTEIYDGDEIIGQGEKTFSVLPPPAPTRIDASQSLNKSVLYPGADDVTVQFTLTGEGTPGTPQRNPIDLIFCIDDSGSMEWGNEDWSTTRPWRIDFAKEAAIKVVDQLKLQDRAAVVEFAGSIWIQQDLTADKDLLKTKISQTPASPWNGTDISGAISKSMGILAQKSSADRDKIIFLVSDGGSDRNSAIARAYEAKANGYIIYAIALGTGADQYLMNTIAEITGGKYLYSPTMEQLDSMMTILAGEIFNTAGKNVVLESTLSAGAMTVDTSKITPAPTDIIQNSDGSTTLKWLLESVIMDEEKKFEITYSGTNLVSGTVVQLTKNTTLTYTDENDATVTTTLPDLAIPVNKYVLDSQIATDKAVYTANEDVLITNTVKNLTDNAVTLTGKVEITDADGNLIKTLTESVSNTWSAGGSAVFSHVWNTGLTMQGTYKATVSWSEAGEVVSFTETEFSVEADASVSAATTVDKLSYNADEPVNINTAVKNNSTNNIETGLSVKTTVLNSVGEIIYTFENTLQDILPSAQCTIKNTFNTAQYEPGEYTVISKVCGGDETLAQSSATFEITDGAGDNTRITGTIQIAQKNIYPADPVAMSYTISNTGNTIINGVTVRVRIADTATGEIVGTVTDQADLDILASISGSLTWTHTALDTGTYMVVYDAVLPDGDEIPLGSSYIMVKKPYSTTISQSAGPRVLVWAESRGNIELSKQALDESQVYYKLVNNRDDFMTELHTGKYTVYLLLDSSRPLTGCDDRELADEIAMGKGIVASGDGNGDNLKNLGLFGVKFTGYTPCNNYSVTLPAGSVLGEALMLGTGKVQKVTLDGGTQLAEVISKKAATPGIVTNTYQNGKSVLFTFDIGSCTGDTANVLKKAVELVSPAAELSCSYAEFEIKVKADTAIGAELKLITPPEAELLWMSPEADAWTFDTAAGQEYTLKVLMKLPETPGDYPVTVDSYYSSASGMQKFESATVNMTVVESDCTHEHGHSCGNSRHHHPDNKKCG